MCSRTAGWALIVSFLAPRVTFAQDETGAYAQGVRDGFAAVDQLIEELRLGEGQAEGYDDLGHEDALYSVRAALKKTLEAATFESPGDKSHKAGFRHGVREAHRAIRAAQRAQHAANQASPPAGAYDAGYERGLTALARKLERTLGGSSLNPASPWEAGLAWGAVTGTLAFVSLAFGGMLVPAIVGGLAVGAIVGGIAAWRSWRDTPRFRVAAVETSRAGAPAREGKGMAGRVEEIEGD